MQASDALCYVGGTIDGFHRKTAASPTRDSVPAFAVTASRLDTAAVSDGAQRGLNSSSGSSNASHTEASDVSVIARLARVVDTYRAENRELAQKLIQISEQVSCFK
jgi:hypothetical protein